MAQPQLCWLVGTPDRSATFGADGGVHDGTRGRLNVRRTQYVLAWMLPTVVQVSPLDRGGTQVVAETLASGSLTVDRSGYPS